MSCWWRKRTRRKEKSPRPRMSGPALRRRIPRIRMESRVHGSHSDGSTGRASPSERHDPLDRGDGRSCDPFDDEGQPSGNTDALAGSATSQRPCSCMEHIRTRKDIPTPQIFNATKKMCGTMRGDAPGFRIVPRCGKPPRQRDPCRRNRILINRQTSRTRLLRSPEQRY